MSNAEKRKNTRRTISYPAMIDTGDGSPPRDCSLCDASQEGAKLVVADAASLPDQFVLALSADGAARRHCRVVWRGEKQVGVEFVKETKKLAQAPPRFHFSNPASDDSAENSSESEQPAAQTLVTLPPR